MQVPGVPGFRPSFFQSSLQIRPLRRALEVPALQRRSASELREFAKQVNDLSSALRGLQRSSRFRIISLRDATHLAVAGATEGDDLGLQLQPTAATLGSSEEVNAISTSYGPFQPVFNGSSTSTPTIGGIYDGSSGDDTLTFKVRREGTVGSDFVRIKVKDGNGQNLQTLNISSSYTPGDPIQLNNGLTLSLSAGSLRKNNTFELDVSASVGSAVDPTQAFDGTGNDIPNFEPGLAVQAGSFKINGASIAVSASDSIQTVLGKINVSAAGVTATFDSLTERVLLTHDEPGAAGEITLGADSTGFFNAVKLSSAVLDPGTDEDPRRAIDQVSEINARSGFFKINGVALQVDTETDSLDDVVRLINAARTGVTASFNSETGKVELSSGANFTLEDGTSGFFAAVGIEEGSYGREARDPDAKQLKFRNTRGLRRGLGEVSSAIGDLMRSAALSGRDLEAGLVRSALDGALRGAIAELDPDSQGDRLSTGLGIRFDLRGDSAASMELEQGQLSRAFERRSTELAAFLMGGPGSGDGEGLIALLSKAVERIEEGVLPLLDPEGSGGSFIDRLA